MLALKKGVEHMDAHIQIRAELICLHISGRLLSAERPISLISGRLQGMTDVPRHAPHASASADRINLQYFQIFSSSCPAQETLSSAFP